MTEEEVIQKLKDDMSIVSVPDIWDRLSNEEINTIESSYNFIPPRKNKKYRVLVACCLIIIISVGSVLVINMSNRNNYLFVLDNSSNIENSGTGSISKIKSAQIYGEVNLSEKSKSELKKILCTYNENISDNIYEDDRYVYNFDSNGNLLEMVNVSGNYNNGTKVTSKDIERKIDEIFEIYLSSINKDDYKIIIEYAENALPAWHINAKKYNDNVIVSEVLLTFDSSGQLIYLSLLHQQSESSIFANAQISLEQAIEIAISEAKKDKYGLIDFERSDIEIKAEFVNDDTYYSVILKSMPKKENNKFLSDIQFKVDIYTGEIIKICEYN